MKKYGRHFIVNKSICSILKFQCIFHYRIVEFNYRIVEHFSMETLLTFWAGHFFTGLDYPEQ